MSITPELLDFAIAPVPSTTKCLGSLTTAKTTISGEGKATWLIEDFNGVTWSLITTAYYVPGATIKLPSPQVYIEENLTKSSLFLDSKGITLTLTCGTILRFLFKKGVIYLSCSHKRPSINQKLLVFMLHLSFLFSM